MSEVASTLESAEHIEEDRFTVEQLFAALDGCDYDSYRLFEQDVIDVFNEHLCDFPAGYNYRDAMDWGLMQGYFVTYAPEPGITVAMPEAEQTFLVVD